MATFTVSVSLPGVGYMLSASTTSPCISSGPSNAFTVVVAAEVFATETDNQVYTQKFDYNGNAVGGLDLVPHHHGSPSATSPR